MRISFSAGRRIWILAIAILVHASGAAWAETLIGRNIDTRFMLAFEANPEGLDALLPPGWTVMGFPNGPLKGATLLLGLEDRLLAMAPDGGPATPPKSRAAALLALAKGDAGVRLFVLRVYSTDAAYDLFPDGVAASVTRTSGSEPAEGGGQRQREAWSLAPESGGSLEVSLEFGVGTGSWGSSETMLFSGSAPEHARLFRYDQLVDLVMSGALGKPLDGSVSVISTVPELSGVFDGSEVLVGLLSIPVYVREVYRP